MDRQHPVALEAHVDRHRVSRHRLHHFAVGVDVQRLLIHLALDAHFDFGAGDARLDVREVALLVG